MGHYMVWSSLRAAGYFGLDCTLWRLAIDSEVKFMGLRHGGNTESGNAELTDAQIRALSGHTSAAMTMLYTKATMRQRRAGARKRLEERTKAGELSK
jgi:integrase